MTEQNHTAELLRHYAYHHPLELLSPKEIRDDLLAISNAKTNDCPVCERHRKDRK